MLAGSGDQLVVPLPAVMKPDTLMWCCLTGLPLRALSHFAMEDEDAPASFAVAHNDADMMEAATTSPIEPGPSRDNGGIAAGQHDMQVAPVQLPTVPVSALEPDAALPGAEASKTAHLERPGPLPPSPASLPSMAADAQGLERVAHLQPHPMREARIPAESSAVFDSGHMTSDSAAVSPVDASQDQGNTGRPLLHSCPIIRPPRPPSAVQPKYLTPGQERPSDAPMPNPSICPPCQPLEAETTFQESGPLCPEPCRRPGASTVYHTAAARHSARNGSIESARENAVTDQTSTITKECGAADCGSMAQATQFAAQARVLKPLDNVMDHHHAHESGSNTEQVESRASLQMSAEQQSETPVAGKRKMTCHSLPQTVAKERRLNGSNSEAITNTVPRPQASPPRQVSTGQADKSAAPQATAHPQPYQQTGAVRTCVGAATRAAHSSSLSMSPHESGSLIPQVEMESAAGYTSTSGKVPDYRKSLSELSASLQEVRGDRAP